ncbi:MAG: hypothetical protein B7X39_09325 [Lysobacterales bacterium 14-68-21]|jgi:ElaB/YqjD/DUF883 family membrane-anchored ribosome-binding protein|nr:MAG: hypothetical protein B7X45_05185 [Xanthomonadales bacterium 15-68-25]OZB66879.1 MAG: hypothetical protein B7X39_09325 [Xanthomonadales bacterium 14-68-21]
MAHVHAEYLKSDLNAIASDVEQLMEDVAAAAGEGAGDVHARLRGIRERVSRLEREAGDRMRRTVARGNRYVHEQPWIVLGGVAAAAFLVGLIGGRARD